MYPMPYPPLPSYGGYGYEQSYGQKGYGGYDGKDKGKGKGKDSWEQELLLTSSGRFERGCRKFKMVLDAELGKGVQDGQAEVKFFHSDVWRKLESLLPYLPLQLPEEEIANWFSDRGLSKVGLSYQELLTKYSLANSGSNLESLILRQSERQCEQQQQMAVMMTKMAESMEKVSSMASPEKKYGQFTSPKRKKARGQISDDDDDDGNMSTASAPSSSRKSSRLSTRKIKR